ncbi:MAG: class I SAM-dependent methyltransferase [Pyrinomonadaceae bacterium]
MTPRSDAIRCCPSCSSHNRRRRGNKNGFEIIRCTDCGTLYTATLPMAGGGQDYDAYYDADNLSVPAFIARRLDEIVVSFDSYRKTNKFLDLGCGAGSLLEAGKRAGWDVEGVEISKPAVEYLRSRSLNAFCGELKDACYPTAHFDVVTASELMEHIADPRPLLREIARVLRPGGLFWATTPHSLGASARLLQIGWTVVSPPEHLNLFSVSGLRKLLLDQGFCRVRIATEGLNPVELLHAWGRHQQPESANGDDGTRRVQSSYRLNEALLSSGSRRAVKSIINGLLRATRLGDSLKVRAER